MNDRYDISKVRTVIDKYREPRFDDLISKQFIFLDRYVDDNKDTLDVGSLDGRIGWMILDCLDKKPATLHLTDYTNESVARCQHYVKEQESNFLKTFKLDIYEPDLNREYDTVIMLGNVLNLIYNPCHAGKVRQDGHLTRSLHNAVSLVKKGGILLFDIDLKFSMIENWQNPSQIKYKLRKSFNLDIIDSVMIDYRMHDSMLLCACRRRHDDRD